MSRSRDTSLTVRTPAAALLACVLLGCAAPRPVFPPVDPPLRWPSSGDPARIEYVGKVEGEADLKRPRSFWTWLRELVSGARPEARIQSAHGVAVTASDVLFVSDPDAHVVHRFDLVSREHRALSDASEGRRFETPIGLALQGGKVLVADRALRTVSVLSEDGEPLAVLGAGQLAAPVGVAAGPSGRVYVADVGAHQVVALDPGGGPPLAIGSRGDEPGQLNFPTHVACDLEENLYVSDSLNARVQVFDRGGRLLRSWGQRGDSPGDFSQPKGIACDAGGRVYVVDSHFENVQIFTPRGELLLAFGTEGNGPGELWLPVGVALDGEGRIWVADSFNRRVQVFRQLRDAEAGGTP
ncbi:MAG: hypothetical protein HY721_08840 [Planctomycetes bacterium]|nr:hypothetical protein [Planctomycetota bacterium]